MLKILYAKNYKIRTAFPLLFKRTLDFLPLLPVGIREREIFLFLLLFIFLFCF